MGNKKENTHTQANKFIFIFYLLASPNAFRSSSFFSCYFFLCCFVLFNVVSAAGLSGLFPKRVVQVVRTACQPRTARLTSFALSLSLFLSLFLFLSLSCWALAFFWLYFLINKSVFNFETAGQKQKFYYIYFLIS